MRKCAGQTHVHGHGAELKREIPPVIMPACGPEQADLLENFRDRKKNAQPGDETVKRPVVQTAQLPCGGHGEESADDHRITFFQGTIIHFFTENRKKEKKRLDYFLK